MKILSQIYTRERSLSYFALWNKSDRQGIKNILSINDKNFNNLFIVPPVKQSGSVYYILDELSFLKQKAVNKLQDSHSPAFIMINSLFTDAWDNIQIYAKNKKEIKTFSELEFFYNNLVKLWTSLNSIIFEIGNNDKINPAIKNKIISFRKQTEFYAPFLAKLATNTFVKLFPKYKNLAHFLLFSEMKKIANNNISQQNFKNISQRAQKGCFLLNGKIFTDIDCLHQVLRKNKLAIQNENKFTNIIKGRPVYGGVVVGKIRNIDTLSKRKTMKKKEILVTQMTTPEFIPQINIASAIITDEGGILCHAAIVAREMKKPCIIGTKIATQVLKDGQLVEVDANKGIVRIIK